MNYPTLPASKQGTPTGSWHENPIQFHPSEWLWAHAAQGTGTPGAPGAARGPCSVATGRAPASRRRGGSWKEAAARGMALARPGAEVVGCSRRVLSRSELASACQCVKSPTKNGMMFMTFHMFVHVHPSHLVDFLFIRSPASEEVFQCLR